MKRLLPLLMFILFGRALWSQIQWGAGSIFEASVGQRGGDMAVSLGITSPSLHLWDSDLGLQLSGDGYITGGELISSGVSGYHSYFSTRLGLVDRKDLNDYIAVSTGLGAVLLFPNDKISSSTNEHYGFYGDIGLDFYTDSTKKKAFFISAGYQFLLDPLVADKMSSSQLLGSGATVSAGMKFFL